MSYFSVSLNIWVISVLKKSHIDRNQFKPGTEREGGVIYPFHSYNVCPK